MGRRPSGFGGWWPPVYLGWMGFGTGVSSVVLGALWAELYGLRHVGAIRAFGTAIMVFSTGLAPMVMGLLYGLASDTSEKIQVRHLPPTPETSDHELFEIVLLG